MIDSWVWLTGGAAAWALILTSRWWLLALMNGRQRLPGAVGGVRISVEPARMVEDQVVKRVWSIPVLFQNTRHKPVPVPVMWNFAMVSTNQRARFSASRYQFKGIMTFEHTVYFEDRSTMLLNPGDHLVAHVEVGLPGDHIPARLVLRTYNWTEPKRVLHGQIETSQEYRTAEGHGPTPNAK